MKIGNATVISFINLKGGVGKTTSAVNIAATLAKRTIKQKPASVLLVDLDPQSNASLTLLKQGEYEKIDSEDNTLYKLFEHEISRKETEDTFDLDKIRITPIDTLNLDLLPSSLKLLDIQDKLVGFHRYYLSATDILYNALNKLKNPERRAYTHIIIDCPPSLGLVTLNGLSLSRYFIVPTFLDAYSHWGLNKIFESVERLKKCKASCETELLGILYSKIDSKTTLQNYKWDEEFKKWETDFKNRLSLYKKSSESIIFKTRIKCADIIRKAEADNCPLVMYSSDDKNLMDQKREHQQEWEDVVNEILEKIEKFKK